MHHDKCIVARYDPSESQGSEGLIDLSNNLRKYQLFLIVITKDEHSFEARQVFISQRLRLIFILEHSERRKRERRNKLSQSGLSVPSGYLCGGCIAWGTELFFYFTPTTSH